MVTEQRIKILIVDDVPEKLLAIRVILEELSEEIVTVESGREALRRLLTEDFAVILLDVDMPDLNGFETAKLIRQRKRSEHTPIIFITGYHDETLIAEGYSLGAVDYILAPVNSSILRTKVGVFVELFKKTEQIKQQAKHELMLTQMQAARDAAENANRAKSEFLANISHELRTPMNSIMGMTELAMEEPQTELAKDYLDTVLGSARVLLGLLNEILDFSRLEAGKFILDSAPFSLRSTIEGSIKSLDIRAVEKGLEVTCDIRSDVPDGVVGDAVRLNQIFSNLVGNAIKFTEKGKVDVRVALESQTADRALINVAITDTGIGISPKDQERIFSPFTQADSSTTRQYGGTGLGLAIASDLISQMGGRLSVQSELERGSTFAFTMVLGRQPAVQQPDVESSEKAFKNLRVLVVDDTDSNVAILRELLREWGADVSAAYDGEAALKIVEAADDREEPFDVVLVDAMMPGLDGFQVANRLQGDRAFSGAVVLMISQGHRQRLADLCLQPSITAVLEKPIFRLPLKKTLDRVLSSQPTVLDARKNSRSVADPSAVAGLRVLVAEDTRINQRMIATILGNRGHVIEIANNGQEALARVENGEFNVILMDVQMPLMDGLQATAAIRRLAATEKAQIPIIALTAHAMPGDRERCLESGMNDYLTKPLDSKTLIEMVEKMGAGMPLKTRSIQRQA